MRKLFGVVLLCVAACSGSSGGTGGGGGGTGTGGGSNAGGGSAGGGSAGGGSGALGGTGNIFLLQSCTNVMGTDYCGGAVTATFQVDDGGYDGWHSCTKTTTGTCTVVDCITDGGIPTLPPPLSAGNISLGGTLADGGITIRYFPNGYETYPVDSRIWNGGETLTVSAAGATVPAFSGKTVTAPTDITLTAPACASDACGSASRSAALNLTWTGASTVQAVLLSAIPAGGGHQITATCNFASSPASVPASVMGALGLSSDGYNARLTVQSENVTSFSAGTFQVSITAYGAAATGLLTVTN